MPNCVICGNTFELHKCGKKRSICYDPECHRKRKQLHNRGRRRQVNRNCRNCGDDLSGTRFVRWCAKPVCQAERLKKKNSWSNKVPRKQVEDTGRRCVDCKEPIYRTVDSDGIEHENWLRCTVCQKKVQWAADHVAAGWEHVVDAGSVIWE